MKESNASMVFVLGHPGYYTRHGFTPNAGQLGFPATYPIPPKNADAWMVQSLAPDGLPKTKGRVLCADALDKAEYWAE